MIYLWKFWLSGGDEEDGAATVANLSNLTNGTNGTNGTNESLDALGNFSDNLSNGTE